jgi:hypothetical protein
MRKPITVESMKAFSAVDVATGCWNWTRPLSTQGYGRVMVDGVTLHASRLMFMVAKPEEWNEDFDVCHRCDNPACINPDHLFCAPHSENMRDMKLKGRSGVAERTRIIKPSPPGKWVKGTAHRDAKLNPEKVKRIRQLLSEGYGYRKLGEMFEVDRTTIRGVAQGRYWKNVQ